VFREGVLYRLKLIPAALLAAAILTTGAASPSGVHEAHAQACPATPSGLAPSIRGPARYTMLLRVNQPANAGAFASVDEASGGLAPRIRSNDVFLVNTRFEKSSAESWSQIVGILRSAFPCNRIFALNGLGGRPGIPGYAYALHDDPRVDGILLDWERIDWNTSRATAGGRGPWTGKPGKSRKRISAFTRGLVGLLGRTAPSKRVGVVPQHLPKWDYGAIARAVDGRSRKLGSLPGLQSVQTQDFCADGGGRGMKAITGSLLRSYKSANFRKVRAGRTKGGKPRFRFRKHRPRLARESLGVQVSFSDTPSPGAGMALLSTSPGRASKCTRAALKRGASAFLYWASTRSLRALFATSRICALRPPASGGCP
jgi:hypothetical protein